MGEKEGSSVQLDTDEGFEESNIPIKDKDVINWSTKSVVNNEVTKQNEVLSENGIPLKEDRPVLDKNKFQLTVEPTMFLTMLALSFQMVTLTNLMIQRICRVTYQESEKVCVNYTSYPNISESVQSKSTDLILYKNLIQTIPAVIFSLFLGAWSDRHGRKFPIYLAIIGYMLNTIAIIIVVYFETLPPEYILISALFVGVFGGMVALVVGTFSLVSDVSTPEARTKRIAYVDLALVIAMAFGVVISGLLENYWGFQVVFGISLGIFCLAFLHTYFFVPETIQTENTNKCRIIKDIFLIKNVLANMNVLCKSRSGNQRLYIILLCLTFSIILLPMMGESSVMLLFVEKKFHWDQGDLSNYTAASIAITSVGMIIIFKFFLSKWKLSDMVLGILGVVGIIIKGAIFAVSVKGWMLYLGVSVSFFQYITMPIVRSYLSKIVDADEIGMVFAVISSVETLVPLFGSVIYTQLYKITKNVFPGAVFAFSASVMIIPLVTYTWIYFDNRKRRRYERFTEQDSNEPQAA